MVAIFATFQLLRVFFLPSSFKLIPLQPTLPNTLITYNLLLKIELNKLMPTLNRGFLVQNIFQM